MKTYPKPEKKAKKIRVKRLSERKSLVAGLDKAVREIVLERDAKCVLLPPQNGHSSTLQAGHLVTRGKMSVRWDLYNVNCQCSGDNLLHEHFPHKYTQWFLDKFGVDQYTRLCKDADSANKLQAYELKELLDQLKKIRQKQLVASLSGETFVPRFTQAEILSGAWEK